MQSTKNQSATSDSASSGLKVDLTQEWWQNFFESGSFLRLSNEQVLLWAGPFLAHKELINSFENVDISISYMNFFGSKIELLQTLKPPLQIKSADILTELLRLRKESEFSNPGQIILEDFTQLKFEDFEKTMQLILGKIQRGEIEKAVPVIFSRNTKGPLLTDKIDWMISLLQTPTSLNAFGFWNLDVGIMGATPEILFHRQQGKVSSMALAGTMPRSEVGQRSSLLKDPKEMHEHQVVVEDLEKQLGKWGWVKKTGPQILELPTLLHLQTLLEVDGVKCESRDLMMNLHPTPALGVGPRTYGYHWLANTSDQEGRRVFGAPISFTIPSTESGFAEEICLVAIRNIQWDQEGCRVGAGCGVVQESLPQQEWQELQQKLKSVMMMLGINEKKGITS